ncbi:hypothetical protein BOQ63_007135 (plasmid) [Streptomyces viridifaciens]|uniref:hypothetical protein n=1 Tax=Kitasatospora aureofaciens TaxID=1894 RepID=UPI0009284287|nr:hypothetical protein CP971_34290 [Streptomyces viridifaciens]UKZ03841.1 hypothetical protein BOQ63_007135 [Streptomyces viridifaciens]
MTEIDIAQLITPAAQTLVSVMMGDLWSGVRDRFARLLSRRSDDPSTVVEELEESRQRLVEDVESGETRNEIAAEWRSRIRRALTQDPSLVDDLRAILRDCAEPGGQESAQVVQTVNASGSGIVFNLGSGSQHNEVHGR